MFKKIACVILFLTLLSCMIPAASAAGSASWGGPSVIRAGDTITLNFYAGGGIYGGSGSVSYDSSLLTLKSYTPKVGGNWAVEFSGNNFVFYDNSMANPLSAGTAIFSATFQVNASAATGATVTVSATGVRLSDGQSDTSIGTVSYQKTVSAPLSGNCSLASLAVSNATISPGFSSSVTSYKASVPYAVSKLDISAAPEHSAAKVSVSNNALIAGGTTTVKITVTAENGTTKTYSIQVSRQQDPNYVKSSDATLVSLEAEGYYLSPAFRTDITQYYVWIPYETEQITVHAQQTDKKSKLSIGTCPELIPGTGTDIPITVTAEDGTEQIYKVTVIRAPENPEDFLSFIPETTEPATEPVTQPVTEAVTEPEAQPTQASTPSTPRNQQLQSHHIVITGVICTLLGAAVSAVILFLLYKKKHQPHQDKMD